MITLAETNPQYSQTMKIEQELNPENIFELKKGHVVITATSKKYDFSEGDFNLIIYEVEKDGSETIFDKIAIHRAKNYNPKVHNESYTFQSDMKVRLEVKSELKSVKEISLVAINL